MKLRRYTNVFGWSEILSPANSFDAPIILRRDTSVFGNDVALLAPTAAFGDFDDIETALDPTMTMDRIDITMDSTLITMDAT